MPVSKKEVGSLSASNVMTLCANHHRQMHYGGVDVTITATSFELIIDGTPVKIPRLSIGPAMPEPLERVMASAPESAQALNLFL